MVGPHQEIHSCYMRCFTHKKRCTKGSHHEGLHICEGELIDIEGYAHRLKCVGGSEAFGRFKAVT